MRFLLLLLALFALEKPGASNETGGAFCTSYVVMNRRNFEVMEGSKIHLSRSVASISKIMTAIIALESEKIFDVVTVDEKVTEQVGSSLYLQPGDQLTVLDLVYGLLLRSGNDAAYALADYLGPDEPMFVAKMNSKAHDLHLDDSTFNNPSGLDMDDAGNISSAYDIAKLFCYAMKNEMFKRITGCRSYKSSYGATWINKNRLLNSYDRCDGGKTGYTLKARRTLVTGASDSGTELAVVSLNCGGDFDFHRHLYEKYFASYIYVEFLRRGDNYIGGNLVKSADGAGLMLEKEMVNRKCIKLYRFDEEKNLTEMYFVNADGARIKVPGI